MLNRHQKLVPLKLSAFGNRSNVSIYAMFIFLDFIDLCGYLQPHVTDPVIKVVYGLALLCLHCTAVMLMLQATYCYESAATERSSEK